MDQVDTAEKSNEGKVAVLMGGFLIFLILLVPNLLIILHFHFYLF